ncbi:MAG: hypothetical protein H8D67_27785 [Deltaproteobacteria bacterium]|nr:hypothetical protein [Deltaproteobacteria bacterium]
MKRFGWQVFLGLFLVVLSIIFYLIHYAIFRDAHHIFLYLIGDIAFVFIEVLMVTLIIHRLLSEREKRSRLEKLTMVIGAFFSEVGTRLLAFFSDFDPKLDNIRKELIVTNNWSEKEFSKISKRLKNYNYEIETQKVNFEDLHSFLIEKKDFLLRLLENPNLLEHESFTDLLRAVFHLTEELVAREDIGKLPTSDYEHLAGDIKRAYILLVHQWLDYMKYLKDNYPYLFSLAMRTNPFDQEVSPVVIYNEVL